MNRQPPIMGCRMQLSDTSSISPSGETLTMGVAANYTVSKRYSLGSFEAVNTRCSRPNLNCPMIVTLNDDSGISDYNFRNECTGVDAGNGCSIVEPDLENWGTAGTHEGEPVPLNKRVQNPDGSWDTSRSSDDTVERRELAVAIEDTTGDNTGEIYYAGLDTVTLRSIDRDIFRGDQESEDLSGTDPFAIVHYRSYDGEYETEIDNNVPGNYCEEGGMKEYKERQAEQEMNVLKWHCPGQEDSSGGSWLEDVLTAMTPFYKGS